MRLGLPWRSDPKPPLPVEAARFEQVSIALEHVMSRLEEAPRCGVLDLGAPIAANVELYARHGSRITFADFYRFYEPTRPDGANAKSFAELLPARRESARRHLRVGPSELPHARGDQLARPEREHNLRAGSDPVGTRFVSGSDVGCTFEPYDRGRGNTPSRSKRSARQAIAGLLRTRAPPFSAGLDGQESIPVEKLHGRIPLLLGVTPHPPQVNRYDECHADSSPPAVHRARLRARS